MLVKILTEHGPRPTIVVWDAGMSGRKEVYAEYKARAHAPRPTCCRSSGRTWSRWSRRSATANVSVRGLRGRRRDRDARRAGAHAEPRDPGDDRDRRPRRLPADRPEGRVRVMATSRGITETKRLRPRGGDRALRHPARADPRLLRPQGRHLGQHPGRPGHRRQDRRAAAAAVRDARGGPRQRRRDLRRQAQGEPARARRRRAHLARSSRR